MFIVTKTKQMNKAPLGAECPGDSHNDISLLKELVQLVWVGGSINIVSLRDFLQINNFATNLSPLRG